MTRYLTYVFVLLLLLAPQADAAGQDPVLLEYFEYSLELHDPDPRPRLRVFESGRAELYFPRHKLRAGLYELQLEQSEMARLRRFVRSPELAATDSVRLMESAVRQDMEQQQRDGTRRRTSEATISKVLLEPEVRNQVLLMKNLRRHPPRGNDTAALSEFRELVGLLGDLRNRRDGKRIDEAANRQVK